MIGMMNAAPLAGAVKATHSEERWYRNERGELCKDCVIHCSTLDLRKKLGDARAQEVVAATQGRVVAQSPSPR